MDSVRHNGCARISLIRHRARRRNVQHITMNTLASNVIACRIRSSHVRVAFFLSIRYALSPTHTIHMLYRLYCSTTVKYIDYLYTMPCHAMPQQSVYIKIFHFTFKLKWCQGRLNQYDFFFFKFSFFLSFSSLLFSFRFSVYVFVFCVLKFISLFDRSKVLFPRRVASDFSKMIHITLYTLYDL